MQGRSKQAEKEGRKEGRKAASSMRLWINTSALLFGTSEPGQKSNPKALRFTVTLSGQDCSH